MLLKFAYHDFLEDREFKNVTEKTLKNHKMFLGEFVRFCEENEVVSVEDVTYIHVKQHLQACQRRGNNPVTINTKLLRINAFLNYMVDCEVIKKNPARKVQRQREDIQINVFTDEQINQMLNYYRRIKQRDKSFYAYRDYMLIVTFLSTGIRSGEATNVKWSDVDLINMNMSVIGKNRTKETVPITNKLAKELSAYQSFCKQYWGELSDYVFSSRYNKQMTINSISFVFKNLSKKMNFKDVRLSPHTFRHTFCHRLAVSGTSTFAIQKLMRHKSINQTMKYVSMWGQELRKENDAHNPLNKMDL